MLRSGEKLTGSVERVADGLWTVTLPGGKSRTLKQADLLRIEFDATPAAHEEPSTVISKAPFETPTDTLRTWRQAAIAGDVGRMVACYASFARDEKRKELKKIPKEAFDRMRAATARTDFAPGEPLYQGDRAVLEVNWTSGLLSDSQVLNFVLERDGWKLLQ